MLGCTVYTISQIMIHILKINLCRRVTGSEWKLESIDRFFDSVDFCSAKIKLDEKD